MIKRYVLRINGADEFKYVKNYCQNNNDNYLHIINKVIKENWNECYYLNFYDDDCIFYLFSEYKNDIIKDGIIFKIYNINEIKEFLYDINNLNKPSYKPRTLVYD